MEKFEALTRIFNNYATNVEIEYFSIDRGRIKKIWKLWNPPHADPVFFVPDLVFKSYPISVSPRKLNISWTKEAEVNLEHYFNNSVEGLLVDNITFDPMTREALVECSMKAPVFSKEIEIDFNITGEE